MKTTKELMQWRFACKQFDPSKKIEKAVLEDLMDTTRLTPSSFGLQSWKFIVITNKELQEKLKPAGFGQAQITDASALVFLCADTDVLGEKGTLERYMQDLQKGGKTMEQLEGFKQMIAGRAGGVSEADKNIWVQKQVYIASMTLMLAAAEKEIDSCPMEGFDPAGVAKVLELPANLIPTVLVSLGYRVGQAPQKSRLSLDEIVEFRD
ncbi:MAG: NAD(P)H-dependent oxidoreductase [Candidatus Altimarinota bacterium]